jgi:3-hydroxyisobutyrate dehydrogenase
VAPASIHRLSTLVAEQALVDAPVLGSITEAEAGTLTVFAGGEPKAVEKCKPLLSTLGNVVYVGPVGAGTAAKLVANSTLFGVLGALGEALALAQGLGLTREAAFDVLAATPLAGQAERRRPVLESGRYEPRFSLSLARKDADLILDAAAKRGIDLRLAPAAREWLAEAEDAGRGAKDYAVTLETILAHAPLD